MSEDWDWYYFQNGSQAGPVSELVVREMLQSGRLRWDDLVWHDGLPDWLSAEQIPNLASSRVVATPVAAGSPPPFNLAGAPVATDLAPFPAQVAAVPVQPLSAIRPLSPSAPAPATFGDVSERTVSILGKTRPWARFLGILAYVGCVLMLVFGLAGLIMGIVGGGGGLAGVGIGVAALVAYLLVAGFILPVGLFLNRFAKAIRALQTSRHTEDLEGALLAQKSYWKYVGILSLVGMAVSVLAAVGMLIFGLAGFMTASY